MPTLGAALCTITLSWKQSYHVAYRLDKQTNTTVITFIEDLGAADHIINKSLDLSDFKKYSGEVIKVTNNNWAADINTYGKGDLFLQSNYSKEIIVKLANVIVAGDISENLIFLRRFGYILRWWEFENL